jgi:hypothetical protein
MEILVENFTLNFLETKCESGKNILNLLDKEHQEFLHLTNGGLFFNNSLMLYGFSTINQLSIEGCTFAFKASYQDILSIDFILIGQDIFANQFFCIKSMYYFLDMETLEITFMGNSFKEFVDVLIEDIDFYSGRSFSFMLSKPTDRLLPKLYFVLGGDYDSTNLFKSTFPDYFDYYHNIAKQIQGKSDGTLYKLILEE